MSFVRLILKTALPLFALVMFFQGGGPMLAQQREFRSAHRILREMADSLAQEVAAQVAANAGDTVSCFVTDGQFKLPAENALADRFSKKGLKVVLGPAGDAGAWRISVLVTDCSVRYAELGRDDLSRRVHVSAETRVQAGHSAEAGTLQSFAADRIDTVQRRERENDEARQGLPVDHGDDSTWQRLLTPVVLIAATIVIVYLFFSIRS